MTDLHAVIATSILYCCFLTMRENLERFSRFGRNYFLSLKPSNYRINSSQKIVFTTHKDAPRMRVKKDTELKNEPGNPWNVYLSGEIHTDWREQIKDVLNTYQVPILFSEPNTVHENSDDCGAILLGSESDRFWHDQKGAGLNGIRRRKLIQEADIVVVRFGKKYKQWNAAFEAGIAHAFNKSIIILHDEEHDHALKEIDAAADAVCRSPEQVAAVIAYSVKGILKN